MLSSHVDKLIRQWGERFRQDPLASRIVASLHNRSDEIWQRTFELLQRESPEYRNSVDEEFTRESKSHCRELLNAIVAIAAGHAERADTDPFHFVRTHAEWRSRHQVPLTASLHASRNTHSPSGAIRPISSATGMNSAGEIMPFSGCRQRNSDSKPEIRSAAMSTSG